MLRPRSRLGLFVRIAVALALIVLVSIGIVWTSGRVRLNRALEQVRASGGPELPRQEPVVTEAGKKTAAWFEQFADEDAWARDELDSTRSIEAFLASHGNEPAVAAQTEPLMRLADALRVGDEEIPAHQVELDHDEIRKQISEQFQGKPSDAREDLEQARVEAVRKRVREFLESQAPIDRWDRVSHDWVSTRELAHANALARASEILQLSDCDPPATRGAGRFELAASRTVFAVQRALIEALPAHAIRGDPQGFEQTARAALALGRMHARCWGLIHFSLDGMNTLSAEDALRASLQFLPPSADLSGIEADISALRPRDRAPLALKQERAIGNEIFLDLRAGFLTGPIALDGKDFIEKQLVRLWWDHEQAGYLEDMRRALELDPRAPFECEGGLAAYDSIGADLREAHWWKMIRLMITPNFRSQARMTAVFEVQQQLTLLCLAARRNPASIAARIATTKDPFTGKPLSMREEDGVLVFSSPGDGSEPIEARLRVR